MDFWRRYWALMLIGVAMIMLPWILPYYSWQASKSFLTLGEINLKNFPLSNTITCASDPDIKPFVIGVYLGRPEATVYVFATEAGPEMALALGRSGAPKRVFKFLDFKWVEMSGEDYAKALTEKYNTPLMACLKFFSLQ